MKKLDKWMALGVATGLAAMLAATPAWARGARSAKELRAVDAISTNALPEASDWLFMGRLPDWTYGTSSDVQLTLKAGGGWSAERTFRNVVFDNSGSFSVKLESSVLKAMVEHGAPWTVAALRVGSASTGGQEVSLASYPYALLARRVAKSRGAFEVAGGGGEAQGSGGSLRVGGRTQAAEISATGKLSAGALAVTNNLEIKGSLDIAGGLSAQSVSGAGTLPVGAIILWYGDAGSVPDGWHICDGSAGTPDLSERFVIGADPEGASFTFFLFYRQGTTGGAKEVTLSIDQMPEHSHDYSTRNTKSGLCWAGGNDGVWQHDGTSQSSAAGGNAPHENLPPYMALYYIKRIR